MQAKPYSGAVFLSCSVDTKQSSGEGGCTVRTKVQCQPFRPKLQAHVFKHLWNDRCNVPLIFCYVFESNRQLLQCRFFNL